MTWPLVDFSSAPPFQQILDYQGNTSGQVVYVGWATCGLATSSAGWKIRKFTYDGNGQVTAIQYAGGDVGFRAIWDNRTSLTYK